MNYFLRQIKVKILSLEKVFRTKGRGIFCFAMLLVTGIYAQQKELKGSVVDENGTPLPGATILIKGTTNGTQTDFDGNFIIQASQDDILVISYVGYTTQSIKVGAKTEFNVTLAADTSTLDEVVVTGYSTQKRNTMATSVSKLDTQVLESASVSNAATALQGTVAGLRVTQTTGQPGATPAIQLRGGTAFGGGGNPLILIDGVPGSFFALNADDIESIEVLKDAASTAIYGARAANGVILVTTKKGKEGRSSITYRHKYSINKLRTGFDYLSAKDYVTYNRQAILNYQRIYPGGFQQFLDGAQGMGIGNNTTDSPFTTQILTDSNRYLLNYPGWQTVADPVDPTRTLLFQANDMSELFFQDSSISDHTLSFDGGNDKGTYYLSLGYLDNEGLVFGSGFERYSGTFNGSYKVLDNVKVSSNVLYAHSKYNGTYLNNDNWVFQRAAGQPPTSRIYNNNPDGSLSNEYNPGTNVSFGNPLYYKDKFIRENLEQRLTASVNLDWDIYEDLRFTLRGSHFTINNSNESFNKAYLNAGSLNTVREASASHSRTMRNQLTAMFNYKKTFGENHNVDAILGAEYFKENFFNFNARNRLSPTDLIVTMNAGAEAAGVPSSYKTYYSIVSTFGQVNYDYDNRLLLGLTFRRDGTSRLGNDKYGFFPGASLGWNLHNESFLKGSKIGEVVSTLKPRVSYGVNGNVDNFGNFSVFGTYSDTGTYNGQTGYANTSLPLLDLRWERSTTLNMGFDLGFFNNRISLLADYYIKDVKDKLAGLTLPLWTGFSSITTNNGTLRNKGLELELNARVIDGQDLKWNLGATFFTQKSFAHKLPENDNEKNRQGGTQIWDPNKGELVWVGGLQEGERVGYDVVVGYVQEYVYANQEEVDEHVTREDAFLRNPTQRYPGDVAWKDVNGDNVINSYDREVLGRTTPDFIGGFTSDLSYKNFNLFVKTDFATGHIIQNDLRVRGMSQVQGNQNSPVEVLNSWTPENTQTNVPRYDFTDPQANHKRGSSRYWEKGDYFALREVTLSYNVPTTVFDNFIKNLRLYATGSNLAYISGYSGAAPESGGFDTGRFPLPRTFTLGLNVTF
ncbi:SusC/RagA family TonB-linked outer membrane protein [Zhouia amylolytica]|nr:TonB-dependent receptor [Zhouia amylolytica]